MMNPLDPSDELFYQISFPINLSGLPIFTIPEDQILQDSPKESSQDLLHNSQNAGKGQQRRRLTQNYEDINKRSMHREIERQRRQEMATLCASLRSLLPLEYIKGKRSISDHMREAVNYIKHLQTKVKELEAQRDELMEFSNLNHVGPGDGGLISHLPIYIEVHPCLCGVEIVCSYSFRKHAFRLSRVLNLLLEEEFNVVSCTCTVSNQRLIHTIRSEVSDMSRTDYSELQRKLTEAISSSRFF